MTKKVYKLQITYTSGVTKEFWVKYFEYTREGGLIWDELYSSFKPIWNGPTNVESVWVIEEQEIEDAVV